MSMAPERIARAANVARENWRDVNRYQPSHNCTPGHDTPVVRYNAEGAPTLQVMR